nr:unnamed protein product [Digitaria exilis]
MSSLDILEPWQDLGGGLLEPQQDLGGGLLDLEVRMSPGSREELGRRRKLRPHRDSTCVPCPAGSSTTVCT